MNTQNTRATMNIVDVVAFLHRRDLRITALELMQEVNNELVCDWQGNMNTNYINHRVSGVTNSPKTFLDMQCEVTTVIWPVEMI